MWIDKWNEDIEFLKETLINKHKNLFFNITRESFENNIKELKSRIENLDYNDMKVEISRVIASIGDSHTAVKLPMNYLLPLEFYWFKEGIYVIKTLGEYKELKYSKVIEINNVPINEVLEELTEIISHENKSYLKANIVKYLQAVELLYGLMIIDDIENCSMKFEGLNGEIKTRNINSVDINKYNELLLLDSENKEQCNINKNDKELFNKIPLYRKNNHKNYWFEYLEEKQILYFKYNSCRDVLEESIEDFTKNIIKFMEKNNVNKLVVDLRNNTGGDSRLLEPFIKYVQENDKINKFGKLFIVIGRDTFSSALLNAFSFKNNTNATLIGEPTGGKPNCYGEIEKFNLPNSKFLITYSTEYYNLIEDDNSDSLLPDINVEVGIYDFINGKDPVLEYFK
ncbi:peptidase S41 [Clostridium gasigenes]|uniref:S41 family peptidase n=1 Tax=Clostridium gasigenes TaxID=94869 RepID=UPI001C0DA3EA|nr:S41 family peptidase [Clostridium gasigenes]MBU3089422.1 peptidase S41 [Clostridium gasigenes]